MLNSKTGLPAAVSLTEEPATGVKLKIVRGSTTISPVLKVDDADRVAMSCDAAPRSSPQDAVMSPRARGTSP